MATPPLDSPCDGPVTYPGDTKILVKSSKERSGPTLNQINIHTNKAPYSHRTNAIKTKRSVRKENNKRSKEKRNGYIKGGVGEQRKGKRKLNLYF